MPRRTRTAYRVHGAMPGDSAYISWHTAHRRNARRLTHPRRALIVRPTVKLSGVRLDPFLVCQASARVQSSFAVGTVAEREV